MKKRVAMDTEILEANTKLTPFLDKPTLGNCLEVLPQMPANCVDMVFFDPPYFLQLPSKAPLIRWDVKTEVQSPEEKWDRFDSFEQYDNFIVNILTCVRRVMKPNATIWAIGTYHNIFRVGKILHDLGFWILNDVIWFKTNAMPNWLAVRLTNATETLIWALKDRDQRYTFNKEAAREYAEEDSSRYRKKISKLSTNVWHIPVCSGSERLKRQIDGKVTRLHPTQKPEKLMERIISISTNPEDVILDPMAGTGTTGVVARRLGRHFIMVDNKQRRPILFR